MLNHRRLHCYQLTLDLARTLPEVLSSWPSGSSELQDQIKRALSSVLLNTAEGNSRARPLDRGRFFHIARGSASEVGAILDVAWAYHWINEETHKQWQEALVRVVQMLYKMH